MGQKRKFSSSFKTKVVLEAMKEREPLSKLASRYNLHPNQITTWKNQAVKNLDKLFDCKGDTASSESYEQKLNKLYEEIGRLKVECDWLKKKS